MAAPIADKIILPLDTGNTGKKKRTQTRVVGADTVHEDFVIPISERSIVGMFYANTGLLTIPAAVHNGTTTGFAWLYNPIGATVKMMVDRIRWESQFTALAVDLLPGELRLSRFTFTGVNSGTLVTPAKVRSADAANQGQFATTWATAIASLGAVIFAVMHQTMDLITGGAGHWNPQRGIWDPTHEDHAIVLLPGEGIVMWHATAVTTANRRLLLNVAWDEFE